MRGDSLWIFRVKWGEGWAAGTNSLGGMADSVVVVVEGEGQRRNQNVKATIELFVVYCIVLIAKVLLC